MSTRQYDGLLLDVDGTLVDDHDRIHPRTVEAIRAADRAGVRVLICTGRSELATLPILAELGLETPAVVFNGAGLWCPLEGRLVEERILSDRTLERAVRFGLERELLTVTMCRGVKYVTRPAGEAQRLALREMTGVREVDPAELVGKRALRVTVFSDRHASSEELGREVEASIAQPIYLTHFPLRLLAHHRDSAMLVADVHPPCRGKGEGVRVLEERFGVSAARVVAVGDADNDVPMFEAAGLAVCMEESMDAARAAADRAIGSNRSDAIAELIEELFLA